MTIQKVNNGFIYGLSSDTKPTNHAANTLFVEQDTGHFFRWSGSTWLSLSVNYGTVASYLIYRSGSTYYADTGAGLTATTTSNTDFATLLQGIINGISPAGTPTMIEFAQGDYVLHNIISIPATRIGNLYFKGSGVGLTRFLFGSGLNGLATGTTIITFGSNITIAAGNTGTLTANTNLAARTATMTTGDGAKFAQGDMVLLKSDTLFVTPATGSSAAKRGEIKQVFQAPASGVVTFDQPAFDTYTTAAAAKLYKLSMLSHITIEDITFQKDAGLTNTGINFVDFYYVNVLRIARCEIIDNVYNYNSGFSLYSCINVGITTCHLIQNPSNAYNLQYGISFNACCQNVVMTDITSMGRFRHTLELANGISGSLIDSLAGVTRNCVIANSAAIGTEVAAFDTHADGEFIIFENCRVLGTYSTYGMMIRSKDTKVINCSVHSSSTRGYYLLENAHNAELINNTVYNAGWYGLQISDGVNNVKIRGGHYRNNADTGIIVDANADNLEIVGVTITGNTGGGIVADDCDNLKIIHNTINGNTNAGIQITQTSRTLSNLYIHGNDLTNQSASPFTIPATAIGTNIIVKDNIGLSPTATGSTTLQSIRADPILRRTGMVTPVTPSAAATATNIVSMDGTTTVLTPTGLGTNSVAWDTTEGVIATWATASTTNTQCGLVAPAGGIGMTRRAFYTRVRARFSSATSSVSTRVYFGFTSNSTLPITDTPLATTEHGVIVGYSSTDTTYQIYHNDGATSVTKNAITGAIAKNTNYHTIEIAWNPSGNIVVTFDGVSQVVSTDLPGTTTNLFFNCVVQTTSAAVRSMNFKGLWFEAF